MFGSLVTMDICTCCSVFVPVLSCCQRNLVALLESSINYLEQAERYETMAEVLKLLQPIYERSRDFKSMMEMFGKLHSAFRKVVDIVGTGRRYLGTYFRIGFYGKVKRTLCVSDPIPAKDSVQWVGK